MLTVKDVGDLTRDVAAGLHRIDRDSFDVVVGIPRSGMIPASMIATALGKPLATPAAFAAGIVHGVSDRPVGALRRVLLVDDSVNRGGAMRAAFDTVSEHADKVTRLAVYGSHNEPSERHVDAWLAECKSPRVFAWNLVKHIRNRAAGWDMDGAICEDWTGSERRDVAAYRAHVASAAPLLLPQTDVKAVVTWRLEKHHDATAAWLDRHGVKYERLVSATTDMREMMHPGTWKADVARSLELELFVESDVRQAKRIAAAANIPVFCVGTQRWVRPC